MGLLGKTVSGIVLVLLLTGMLTLAFNVEPAESAWTGTVYIRADGSVDPPDAPIITYDKITYTLTGNISSFADGIVVERDNIVIDGGGYTVKGTGEYPYKGIDLSNRINVTIQNINIQNFHYGIWLYESYNNSMVGNNITNNYIGINLDSSSHNIIVENNCGSNTVIGINLFGVNNTLRNNNVSFTLAGCGIFVNYGYNNTIINNVINSNCEGGIILTSDSCYNIIINNNISLNYPSSGIYLDEYSNNNTITENNMVNNTYGIYINYAYNNNFFHNNFINNTQQVYNWENASINVWDDGYPSGGNYWSDYAGVDEFSGPDQDQPGSDGIGDTPYVIDANNTDRYPLMSPWTPTPVYVEGIDVSHHQGSIDWAQVCSAGYRFAFVKASEGVGWTDPNFEANMENGREAGLLMGAYHFARPDLGNSPVDEAEYFINIASKYLAEGFLRPVLDLERGASLGKDALSEWVHTWMETVRKETGIEPILYVNSNYANNYLDESLTKYYLWIAHWTYDISVSPNTGIWESWSFWQYSDNGSIPGIAGGVDLDLFNGDMQKLCSEFTIPTERTFHVSWEDKTYSIVVQSDSSVSHLIFDQPSAQISFILSGETGSTGYCNVIIPKSLLKGEPWTVAINRTSIAFQWEDNTTHSFIYFSYTFASRLEVTIEGTWVVPEFPSTMILLMLMLTTLTAATISKKRKPKP